MTADSAPLIDLDAMVGGLRFPYQVGDAQIVQDVLVVSGVDWSLELLSAWRAVGNGILQFGLTDDRTPARVHELVNDHIVAVLPQSTVMPNDPRFVMRSGLELEVFTDSHKPSWRLRLATVSYFNDPRSGLIVMRNA